MFLQILGMTLIVIGLVGFLVSISVDSLPSDPDRKTGEPQAPSISSCRTATR